MSDGITDVYRMSDYGVALEIFEGYRERFTLNPNEENRAKLKEAFNRLHNTRYGRWGCQRLIKQHETVNGYLDYLKTINSIMVV